MPTWLLNNTTRHPHRDLARQLRETCNRIAPFVTRVTGLPLPPSISLNLVTPGQYSKAARHLLAQDLHGSNPLITLIATQGIRAYIRLTWPATGGVYLNFATAPRPQLFFIPAALHRLRIQGAGMDALLAHELTHVAQAHAYPPPPPTPILLAPRSEALPETLPALDDAQYCAVEGHAEWARREVCQLLHGDPNTPVTPPGVRPPRRMRLRAKLKTTSKRPHPYRDGYSFIAAVHEAGGLPLANLAWSDPTCAPTREEIRNPEDWIARYENRISTQE